MLLVLEPPVLIEMEETTLFGDKEESLIASLILYAVCASVRKKLHLKPKPQRGKLIMKRL